MTEITPHDPSATTSFLPSLSVAGRVWNLAQQIHRTEFVPGSLRGKPEAIMAAMLTGREIGIGAMHSLRAIDVIDGRPSLSPELLHALALRAGHDLDVEESDRLGATVAVRRHDWPADRIRRVTFDEVDARLAGLVGQECKPAEGVHPNTTTTRSGNPTCGCKQGYRTYPRAMYRARAIAEACRTYLPDVVERIGYTAEEFGGENPPHESAVEQVREALGDEAADRIAEQLADDEVLEADVVEDEPEEDEGGGVEPDPEPEPGPVGPDEARAAIGDDGVCPNGCDDPECAECYVQEDAHPATAGESTDPEACAHTGARDRIDTRGATRCRACGQVFRPADDAPPFDVEEPAEEDPAEVASDLEHASLLAGSVPEIVTTVARDDTLDPVEVWAAEERLAAAQGRDPRVTLRRSLGVVPGREGEDTGDAPSAPETASSSAVSGDEPAPVHVPEGMPEVEREYRRTVLKRYRTVYREVYDADVHAAARLHALRLETVGSTDEAALWVGHHDVERLEEGIAKIRAEVLGPSS